MLAFLLLSIIPPILIRHETLFISPTLNLLDGSWALDVCYKAATGVWVGRDVAFTYGPLYQWLSSAPSRLIGISTGTILATSSLLPLFVVVMATFASARLLLPEVSAWRRALFIALAVVFWSPPEVRVSVCLLAFLIFVRIVDAVAEGTWAPTPLAIAAATICLAGFLLSADTGLYSVSAYLLAVMATAIVKLRTVGGGRRLCMFLVLTGACFAALVLVTNAVMLSPLNFTYWKSSLTIASGYRWFIATGMTKVHKRWILEALALGTVVFSLAWWRKEPVGERWTKRPAFLLSGFSLAFLMMQIALVRSDHPHVLTGIYPIIFLCGAIVIGESNLPWWQSAILLTIIVVVTSFTATPNSQFLPSSVLKRGRELFRPILVCPGSYQRFDGACFPPPDTQLFSTVSTYVDRQTSPPDSILIFPYQNAFGVMSRRRVAGGVLQGYLVNGDYLTELDLAGLRKTNPPFGLYIPDGIHNEGLDGVPTTILDGVPSFTRSPGIWFYLLHQYRAESSPAPGVLGLLRDDTRDRRLTFTEKKVANASGEIRVKGRNTTVDLGQVDWPASGADFLKFGFRAKYPLWWLTRKPSALTLQMSFVDGSQKSIRFLVEPNRDRDVWVYPWDEKEMGSYFSNDESQWRSGHPALNSLRVVISPFDWISVAPESVSVGDVVAVRVDLR